MTKLRPTLLAALLVCGLLLPAPKSSGAQTQTRTPDTTSATRLRHLTRFWVSGGIGSAGYYETGPGVSLRTSATLSFDRAVVMVRKSDSFEGIDGHTSLIETSVLAGMRFGRKSLYVIPALGVANAYWLDDYCTEHAFCTPSQAAQYESKGSGFAYDVGLHASKLLAGLAVNVGGIATPRKRRLFTTSVSLELGWFER